MLRYVPLSPAAMFLIWLCGLPLAAQERFANPPVSYRNASQPGKDYVGDPLPPQAIMRFGTLRFLHPSTVAEMVLSPDEQTIVTLNHSALIAWDTTTGQELWRKVWSAFGGHIIGPTYGQRYAAFSSDSSHFYTTSSSGKVLIWDARMGTLDEIPLEIDLGGLLVQLVQRRVPSSFESIDVNQAATRFLAGTSSGIMLFDREGKQLWVAVNAPPGPDENTHDRLSFGGRSSTGIFSPDEKCVACVLSQDPKQISLLDLESGKEISTITLSDKLVRMVFAPDGSSIVATERDCATRCYSIDTQQLRWEHVLAPDPQNAESYTSAVDCSSDGKLVAVGAPIGPNNRIYLLDALSGKEVKILSGHEWKPWAVKFSKDNQTLYSTGWDAAVRRWNVSSGNQLPLPVGIRGSDAVTISRDGKQIAFGDGDGIIHVLNSASGVESSQILPRYQGCSVLTFAPNGETLFVGGQSRGSSEPRNDDRLEVGIQGWNLLTGKMTRNWHWPRGKDPHSDVEALAISSDGQTAAAAVFRQNTAYLWDIEQDKPLVALPHNQVYGLDISRDSMAVATVGWDGMLRLWEIATGELICEVSVTDAIRDRAQNGDLRMYGVKFSPDGRHLACAHMDGKTTVWEVSQRKTPSVDFTIDFQSRFIFGALDYSPDGLWLALGGMDGSVRLFDAHFGTPMWNVGNHAQHTFTVAFGSDSRTLVSGGGGMSYAWTLVPGIDDAGGGTNRNDLNSIKTPSDVDAAWKLLDSKEPDVAYRTIWALAQSPTSLEHIVDRIMQVQTVIDPKGIARGQTEEDAQRRLELAAKAKQKNNTIEFTYVIHRALIAIRYSESANTRRLLEKIRFQHSSETVRKLVERVQ